ncbi:hypothetical protein [uncultured Litoreibacter sp.]|uniref:hypothetical protein n=1 Tax=uncultured Litoreibacter sp. TaxID=1392394 RepID=UPI002638805F|nr:hypothetical protein [uncultured Litoreibacter sp.]
MILPIIAGIVVRQAVKYAAKQALKYGAKQLSKRALKQMMKKAQKRGEQVLRKEMQRRKNCKTCKKLEDLADPCQFLRKGNPAGAGKYRGGSYGGAPGSKAGGLESHHIPAQAAYGRGSMSPGKMPAIQMDVADHRKTASWGPGGKGYARAQRQAMKKGGAMAAFAMDVADIKMKFGNKYDTALTEAGAYVACITKFKKKYPTGR